MVSATILAASLSSKSFKETLLYSAFKWKFHNSKYRLLNSKNFHSVKTVLPPTKYLKYTNSNTNIKHEIAYKKTEGSRDVGLLYVPGFMSSKTGEKATAFEEFSQQYGYNFIRYDATGLGESKPIILEKARLSHWIEDAEQVLLKLTSEPQILIGSSMGAWVSLILAMRYPERVHSLLLISPGINFVQRFMENIQRTLPSSVKNKIESGEVYQLPTKEYGSLPVSLDLALDMIEHDLNLEAGLDITCPVRIVQGLLDEDVPYLESLDIMKSLKSSDVELTYIKNGQHRLCEKNNLELICDLLLKLTSKPR